MNMETEMEWNSHMMKSGRVFGTYDFMISKGHTLAEMNYVIWDVEDNSYMPLVKAVAVTLDTHPDILLKDNAMGASIEADQAEQARLGLEQQRQQYPQATYTGTQLAQGGKPIQGAIQGIKNVFTGGRSSSGEPRDVDAQSPNGQRDRMKRLDPVRHPIRALGAMAGGSRDRGIQSRAGATTAQQMRNLSQLTNGGRLDRDDLSDKEKGQFDKIKRLLDGDADDMGSKDRMTDAKTSRGFGDRMMDASNAKWKSKNPDSLNSQSPYPNRYDYLLDAGEPAIDEEMDEDDLAAVEETEAGMNTDNDAALTDTPVDKPNEEMPEEESVVNPRHADINEAVDASGYSKERLQPLKDQLTAFTDSIPEGEQVMLDDLVKIGLKGRRGENAKAIIAALSSKWDLTPREIEAIKGALGDENEDEVGIEEPSIDDEEPSIEEGLSQKAKDAQGLFNTVQDRKAQRKKADKESSIDDDEPSIEDSLNEDEVPISAKNKGIIEGAKAKDKAKRQADWEAQGGQEARDAELAAEKKAKKKKGGAGKKKGKPAKQEKKKTVIDNKDDFISSSDAVDSAWDYLSLLKGR